MEQRETHYGGEGSRLLVFARHADGDGQAEEDRQQPKELAGELIDQVDKTVHERDARKRIAEDHLIGEQRRKAQQ